MATVNHENAIGVANALTAIETAEELAEETEMDEETAEKILHVVETRANDVTDLIVVVDEWAYAEWSDYDITSQPVLLSGHVEDYSEAAYKLQSTFEVQVDVLQGKSLTEVEETYITSLVQQVDETAEDFHDEKGEMFLPKSAVSEIIAVQ